MWSNMRERLACSLVSPVLILYQFHNHQSHSINLISYGNVESLLRLRCLLG
ncbi:hypothetical protein LguiA_015258 [Lonicera macranthoides]